jgi:hypothetical protein
LAIGLILRLIGRSLKNNELRGLGLGKLSFGPTRMSRTSAEGRSCCYFSTQEGTFWDAIFHYEPETSECTFHLSDSYSFDNYGIYFLNSRNSPYSFAQVDFHVIQFGNVSAAVRPYFLNMHTMLLNGQMGDDYGRIVAWTDDERAFQWMVVRIHTILGVGVLVLEAQERVLRFLVDYCATILHDLPLDQLMSGSTSINSDISSSDYTTKMPYLSSDTSEVPSLATIAPEAPSTTPARLG